MSELRTPCVCPRPTAQIEQALDRLTELELRTVITPEMRQYRANLERQLMVAQPNPTRPPTACIQCGGIKE